MEQSCGQYCGEAGRQNWNQECEQDEWSVGCKKPRTTEKRDLTLNMII